MDDSEDPWANAWGGQSWSHSTPSSWSTGNDTSWNSHLTVKEWDYDTVSLEKPSTIEPSHSPSPITAEEIPPPSPPLSPPRINPQSLEPANLPDHDEPPIPRSRPPTPSSPDAFGSFETGLGVDGAAVDPWGHMPAPESGEANAWVPTWGEGKPKSDVEVKSEPVDEWETARQRKEKQDRHVPPEVLSSILGQFEELANELWPKTAENNNTSIADFHHERPKGIEGIEGIMSIVDQLIPQDLTLPQLVHFSKTFTSKQMNEALRLTRHMETVRSSPMALYMASKGSTAWETSVKSRPEVLKDDLLPPGWRIIEKEEPTPATDNKKKTSGGLLSFFGRRGNPPLSEANPKLVESLVQPVRTPPPGVANTSSPRASVDDLPSLPPTSSPVRPSSSSVTASSDPALVSTLPPPPHPAPPLPPQAEIEQAPSAVSRFLNRFSRNKSSNFVSRNSLALSSDDIEFLSDIVPSASEEDDEDLQLKGLSNMIASSPLQTKLPPPLAPPPRASAFSSSEDCLRSKSPTLNEDLLSISSSTSLDVPDISQTQQPSVIPMSLSSPIVPVASSNLSNLSASSLRTASRSGSTFSSPPASRSQTPLPPKRAPTVIMSTVSSTIPPNSSFNFPRPPSSTRPLILPPPPSVSGTPSKFTLPPPPTFRSLSPKPSTEANSLGSTSSGRSSDFYQPPSHALGAFDISLSSAFSDDSLMHTPLNTTTSQSNDLLDDFDDFVSSPLRTPSPPRPPQKATSFVHRSRPSQPSLRSISPNKPQPPLPPRKTSRAANHQRTLSLLETAAAHPGRWPAPPSPLPDTIPPPGTFDPSFDDDLLAGGSVMQDQQVNTIASLGASVSSPVSFSLEASASQLPAFLPVASATLLPSSSHLRAVSPPIQQKKPSSTQLPITSPKSATSGGLSAQDLSFFEAR